MKEITFNEEAQELLLEGINELNQAVSSTMGPNGSTVIISDEYGNPYITKDGVSVARSISFKNPIKNIGATLIKQAAEKTVKDAGDGTTTATVLATAFVNNLKDFNSNDINKAFDEIIPKVLEQLKSNSRELKREDIGHVATISANNDIQIGNLIQQAYNHSNIVKVEESNNSIDELVTHTGMNLEVTYFSKHFITDRKKGLVEFNQENISFLLLDGKLDKLEPFKSCIDLSNVPGNALVIMTEHIHEQSLRKLESLVLSNDLPLVVIKTPGFGPFRKELLKDISDYTGAKIITDMKSSHKTDILGKLTSAKISHNNSLLVKHDSIDVSEKIEELEEYVKTDLEQHTKDLLNKRIENLKGKVSIIKVGGTSELEIKERKDRIDDAVLAVACALEEGIVEGGGWALNVISNKYKFQKEISNIESQIYNAISEPNQIIGIGPDKTMFDLNIIDPLKVTRCALENAVSVAKIILSTKAVVLNQQQWRQ